MSIISAVLLAASLAIFLVGIILVRRVWRWRTAARDDEAIKLRQLYDLTPQDIASVMSGETTPAKLRASIWERAIANGVDFETVQQHVHNGRELAPSARTQTPLRLQPMLDSKAEQISEIVHGASPDISGYMADVWFYTSAGRVSHLVLAGHTNGPVCRQITGLIMNTFLVSQQPAEALLVPGACLLRAPVSLSKIQVTAPPEIRGSLPFRFDLPPPLDVLRGDFEKLNQPTGLTHLYDVTDMPYGERRARLISQLQAAYRLHGSALVRRAHSGPITIFMPYFDLRQSQTKPLMFTVPLALFDSHAYRELVNIHGQALFNELTQDAQRRKKIYEEWLAADEESAERYIKYYQGLKDEEKNRKNVHISGKRNYLTATIENVSEGSSETYISPHEYVENVLPALLREDRSWIGQMDKLVENLQKHDPVREQALQEINLGTLIDSFLRGWPSIFLSGAEAKGHYDDWCEEKRHSVWTYLHSLLASKDMRIEPLQEHNTFFHVKRLDDATIQITPLHALDEGNFLAYLSPDYGIPFYINCWSRRKTVYASRPKGANGNSLQARRYFAEAAALLDQAGPLAPPEAIAKLRQALIYQPFIAGSAFWEGWWQRFSRDTTAEFDTFQELMRAIRAFNNNEESEKVIVHLRSFIQQYPNAMPDPYLLMAYLEVFDRLGLRPLGSERTRLLTRQREAERLLRGKEEYLESNKDIGMTGFPRPSDFQRVKKDAEELKTELESNRSHVDQLTAAIEKQVGLLWQTLAESTSPELAAARQIDAAYVERFLRERTLQLSPAYRQRYEPLHGLLKGDEYVRIGNTLYGLSAQLRERKLDLDELTKSVLECMTIEYVDRADLKQLADFAERLQKMGSMDAVLREFRIRQDLDEMSKTYFERGQKLYDSSVTLLPEFTEPLKRIVMRDAVNRLAYRTCIHRLTSLSVPLRNFAPQAQFISLTDEPFVAKRFEFSESEGHLVAYDENNVAKPIASVTGLNEEEKAHLKTVVTQAGFARQISPGLTPAQAVLNHRIPVSPASRRWSEAVLALEPWLVKLMAYFSVFPVEEAGSLPPEDVMNRYESPAVEAVDFSLDTVAAAFLAENKLDSARVAIVAI